MNGVAQDIRSVVVEREMPFPPERVWRALTQPHLLAEWLMKTDFAPELGRDFQFHGDWGSVDGKVLEIEPNRTLAYSWGAMGLQSTVTWTLTPTANGTRLRLEHAGFGRDQEQAYRGATAGWHRMIGALEALIARTE